MKAITLHQPWASFIADGLKTVETRSWSTKYRGPLAIHAAKRPIFDGPSPVEDWGPLWHAPRVRELYSMRWGGLPGDWIRHGAFPLGAIVATCTLADVVPMVELGTNAHHDVIFDDDPYVQLGQTLTRHFPTWAGDRACIIEDQREVGDFAPGRFAWILEAISPFGPVPARGRQQLWEWTAA